MAALRTMLDIIRFFRVRDWWYFLLLPLTTAPLRVPPSWQTGAAFALAAGCLAFAYGWNQVVDANVTTAQLGARCASTGFIKGFLMFVVAATALLGLATGATQAVVTAISLASGAVYSGGPRIKRFPILCTAANAWIFAPLCLLGMSDWHAPERGWLLTALFTCLLLQNQLLHEAAHALADRHDAIVTTFLRFGARWAQAGVLVFGIAGLALVVSIAATTGQTRAAVAATASALLIAMATAAALTPTALTSAPRAARIRTVQRWVGLVAGGLAWAAARWPTLGA